MSGWSNLATALHLAKCLFSSMCHLNMEPHLWHESFFTSEWRVLCQHKFLISLVVYVHWSHIKSLTVCVHVCLSHSPFLLNHFLHPPCPHWYPGTVMCLATWDCKSEVKGKTSSQCMQGCWSSFVCIYI